MGEAGGPATQGGIFFQNTIAALYLGRMLDLRSRASCDRVVHVRVEAPEFVDDMVVRFADGSRCFIQAKRSIMRSSNEWNALWGNLLRQFKSAEFREDDRLKIVIGKVSTLGNDLRECCERAASASDEAEYQRRLTQPQRQVFDSITSAVSTFECDQSCVRQFLRRVDVEIFDEALIERDHAPLWMPESTVASETLLSLLRDMAGGAARIRGNFDATALREKLNADHNVNLSHPIKWGSSRYRTTLLNQCIIEVPGTDIRKRVDEGFIWPRVHRYDRSRRPDFEDETPNSVYGVSPDEVDIASFPCPSLDRLVVVAGPGFGKSALLLALTQQLINRGRLPANVSIPELSRLDVEIGEYLRKHLNDAYEVKIDWIAAAESGLLVLLLDGLDEVSSARRTLLLKRIKTFVASFPAVPWALTVRDAGALAAPINALIVQLEPFNDDDIWRFVSLYRPDDADLPERLSRQFRNRPDLQRLVRIPLFLAILLATTRGPQSLPSNRSDLLETYLDLLFRPDQFKQSELDSVDVTVLRPIAEAVAFAAMEREEIGVERRLIENESTKYCALGSSIEQVIEKLAKCGVLRRKQPGRYEFPFPVVQEYLAACHILANRLDEIPERLRIVVTRPWAQALQFALERHLSPNEIVEKCLARDDDAFSTNLRLIARCVANGMRISPLLHRHLATQLTLIWPSSSWRMRGQIGDLLAEAFFEPLIPELRKQLANAALLHCGAGTIVERIADDELTFAVLSELLEGCSDVPLNLYDLQLPVRRLGGRAFEAYASKARASDSSEADKNAIASLMSHLEGIELTEQSLLSVALDTSLVLSVRLAVFALGPAPIDARATELIEEAMLTTGYQPLAAAFKAISKSSNPKDLLNRTLLRSDISLPEKVALVRHFPDALLENERVVVLLFLARVPLLPQVLRHHLLVYAARYGAEDAMADLVNQFDELPTEIVCATLSIFGHHPSRALVETACIKLRGRVFSPQDRVKLVANAILGMTVLFEMMWMGCGTLKPAPRHPGLTVFRPLVQDWAAMTDYVPLDALRVGDEMARFGSGDALNGLRSRIMTVLQMPDTDLLDHTNAHLIGTAIRTLAERQCLLDLPFLESIVARCSHNAAAPAAQMIAAHGTRDALNILLKIHKVAEDSHLRGIVCDVVEVLSMRLGLRIKNEKSELLIESN